MEQTKREQIKTFKHQGTKSKLAKLRGCTFHFSFQVVFFLFLLSIMLIENQNTRWRVASSFLIWLFCLLGTLGTQNIKVKSLWILRDLFKLSAQSSIIPKGKKQLKEKEEKEGLEGLKLIKVPQPKQTKHFKPGVVTF